MVSEQFLCDGCPYYDEICWCGEPNVPDNMMQKCKVTKEHDDSYVEYGTLYSGWVNTVPSGEDLSCPKEFITVYVPKGYKVFDSHGKYVGLLDKDKIAVYYVDERTLAKVSEK